MSQAVSARAGGGQVDTDALREEATRLRAENEQLRSHFRVAEPKSPGQPKSRRPTRVILLPDPLVPREPGKLGA